MLIQETEHQLISSPFCGGDAACNDRPAVFSLYNETIFRIFADKFAIYSIVPDLKTASSERSLGNRCVSIREADIVCRSKLDIGEGSIIDQMLMESDGDFFLSEGIVGVNPSPWELRVRYNKGIQWFRNTGSEYSKELADACDGLDTVKSSAIKTMILIRDQIELLFSLAFWDDEIYSGFNEIFLTPEYMSIESYSFARRSIKQCVTL
jgi:hypothetical protein